MNDEQSPWPLTHGQVLTPQGMSDSLVEQVFQRRSIIGVA